jgi:hypothetical protein
MTKKTYELIAACFGHAYADARTPAAVAALDDVRDRIAHEFHMDNSRFDRDRFTARVEAIMQTSVRESVRQRGTR